MTIAERFDPHRNSLNALRVIFATLVIVSHTLPLGGFGIEPDIGGTNLGRFAVGGFFAISGYLIAGSRDRSGSIGPFLWRRFVRIYPAYFVALLAVAFILAPLSVLLGGSGPWLPAESLSFVIKNVGFYYEQVGVPQTLANTPYQVYWLGTLWTLTYEFVCYLGIGAFIGVVPKRRLGRALSGVVLLIASLLALSEFSGLWASSDGVRALELALPFSAGALLYVYRHRISLNKTGALISLFSLVAAMALHQFTLLGSLPLAYLIVYLGATVPFYSGSTHDLSYGIYIYGWPVQQLLAVVFGAAGTHFIVFTVLSVVLTIPLAAASWFFVERPAMKLKNWRPKFLFARGDRPAGVALDWFVAAVVGCAVIELALGTIRDGMFVVIGVALIVLVVAVLTSFLRQLREHAANL